MIVTDCEYKIREVCSETEERKLRHGELVAALESKYAHWKLVPLITFTVFIVNSIVFVPELSVVS